MFSGMICGSLKLKNVARVHGRPRGRQALVNDVIHPIMFRSAGGFLRCSVGDSVIFCRRQSGG